MLPVLEFRLDVITHNARQVVNILAGYQIEAVGVIKGCCAFPEVAKAVYSGGIDILAGSRLANLAELRQRSPAAWRLMMLRTPALSEVNQVVAVADVSLNSEPLVLENLGQASLRQNTRHAAILMVDLGDRREGVCPEDLVDLALQAKKMSGISVWGIGTTFACFEGLLPSVEKIEQVLRLKAQVQRQIGTKNLRVSLGSSSLLSQLLLGNSWNPAWQGEISQFRIGESLLLGNDIVSGRPLDGFRQDACLLYGEIIEVREKPVDGRAQLRAIIALGKQDLGCGQLTPIRPDIRVYGASSDHLVVEVGDERVRVGDCLAFYPDYWALLAASTSPLVDKRFV